MKLKIFNKIITILAAVGVIVFIGAIGNMDYMVTIGENYPLSHTLRTVFIGIAMTVPAIIREEVR